MAKLYEICNELNSIIQEGKVFCSTETGEVFSEEALNSLKMERNQKVENCLMVMRDYETDAEKMDSEIKRLTALKRQYSSRAEWLKNYVRNCLNGETFKGDKFQISYRNSKAVVITDYRKVPEIFYKDQTEKDILKSEILNVLKNGGTVPGAELEERVNMVVK